MEPMEFWQAVQDDEHLAYRGELLGELIVRDVTRDKTMALDPRAVLEHDWDVLRACLRGERAFVALGHVCRIVGYFSNMRNWNRSKLAEQAARRRGHYGEGGVSVKLSDEVPQEVLDALAMGGRMACAVGPPSE